jgi:DNA-binding MarR family transcriptional regulator
VTTSAAPPTPTTDDAMWNAVGVLHSEVEHRLATALQRLHGMGLSEFRALAHLATAADSELRMQELADRIGLNQSSVTRLVARLNTAGFTYRDICPDDKRGIYTVLTDDGRDRYTAARATYQRTLTEALDEAMRRSPRAAAMVTAMRTSAG